MFQNHTNYIETFERFWNIFNHFSEQKLAAIPNRSFILITLWKIKFTKQCENNKKRERDRKSFWSMNICWQWQIINKNPSLITCNCIDRVRMYNEVTFLSQSIRAEKNEHFLIDKNTFVGYRRVFSSIYRI
jgi:hypothetical protein